MYGNVVQLRNQWGGDLYYDWLIFIGDLLYRTIKLVWEIYIESRVHSDFYEYIE